MISLKNLTVLFGARQQQGRTRRHAEVVEVRGCGALLVGIMRMEIIAPMVVLRRRRGGDRLMRLRLGRRRAAERNDQRSCEG
ncbi:MAG: hypothetical protein HYX37_09840 [Rhizobiales bacterium]|nr:hypothetical protein [Hyphomicrobiales bacterium]